MFEIYPCRKNCKVIGTNNRGTNLMFRHRDRTGVRDKPAVLVTFCGNSGCKHILWRLERAYPIPISLFNSYSPDNGRYNCFIIFLAYTHTYILFYSLSLSNPLLDIGLPKPFPPYSVSSLQVPTLLKPEEVQWDFCCPRSLVCLRGIQCVNRVVNILILHDS